MTAPMQELWRFSWIELARARIAWVTLACLALAAAAASSSAMREVATTERAIASAQELAASTLAAQQQQGEAILAGHRPRPAYWLNPADVRGFGYYEMVTFAVKPTLPAAALSVGSLDVLPSYVRVRANSAQPFTQAYELDNPHQLVLGRFDPAFVVIYVLPLMLIALGHDVLARERAGSRLALLVLHGVTPARLVATRLAIVFVAASSACLLPALALQSFADAFDAARAGLWGLVALSYAAVWTGAIGVIVSVARRRAAAAAALGALWVTMTLIVPWLLAATAEWLFPSPSRVEQILHERAAVDAIEAGGAAAIDRYVSEHPEMELASAPPDFYTAQQIALNAAIEGAMTASDTVLGTQLDQRQRLIDRLSWLAPGVLAAEAMVDLGGTGWSRHRAFLQQGRAYVAALRGYFDPKALGGAFEFRGWQDWPRFEWREPPLGPAAARAAWTVIALSVLAIGLCALARYRLGRTEASRSMP
jgi:ABC-2 type transport system permease protein